MDDDEKNIKREQLLQILQHVSQLFCFHVGRGALSVTVFAAFVKLVKVILQEIDKLG